MRFQRPEVRILLGTQKSFSEMRGFFFIFIEIILRFVWGSNRESADLREEERAGTPAAAKEAPEQASRTDAQSRRILLGTH